MLKGLQYFNDAQGKPNKVLVDLNLYGAEFALFLRQLQQKYGTQEAQPQVQPNNTSVPQSLSGHNARILKIEQLVNQARQYLGTPYRTGGTTRSGMDCSGLTSVVFAAIGLAIPRVSRDQALVGQGVDRNDLAVGDLLFFATGTPGRINHVGMVSEIKNGQVRFIHASSSRGVMESDLSLDYWAKTYITARRLL